MIGTRSLGPQLALALAMAVPQVAFAQADPAVADDAILAKIQYLEAELATLRRQIEDKEKQKSTVQAPPPTQATPEHIAQRPESDVPQLGARPVSQDTSPDGFQPLDICDKDETAGRAPADATLSGVFTATNDACVQRTVAEVLLSAIGEGATVSMRLSSTSEKAPTSAFVPFYQLNTFAVTASAPVSKADRTNIASLDGFASASKLAFGFTFFRMPFPTRAMFPAWYLELAEKARVACVEHQAAAIKADRKPEYDQPCGNIGTGLYSKFLTIEEHDRIDDFVAGKTLRRASAMGIELSIGHEEFEYRDNPDLKKSKTSRVPLGAKGSVSFFPVPRSSFTAAIDYQRTFKASSTQTVCPTDGPGPTIVCTVAAFGQPKETELILASGEFRRLLEFEDVDFIPRMGIAPRVQYDLNNKDFSAYFPIYLAPDSKGKLIGGLQASYTIAESDPTKAGKEKNLNFGLFVGSAFTLP